MHVEDLDISANKIAETAQRIVDRATEEARRRDHALLTNEHIFLAFAQVEWDTFAEVMRDVELNPHTILQAIEEHLQMMPSFAGRDLRVAPATKLVFKLALHHGSRNGRQTIEAVDLFSALFEETQGVPVTILRRHGVEPDVLVSRLNARMRDLELREERLKKRFELPPFLKHFATNLNLLARQDKLPPVFGRDREIEQVLEILCHRERANSVMLLGEPGVGKTAIVEGLARRIEFEPDTVPVRLRDIQLVNLQMNTMVAGTMLRGMFEDRIQNVIRELKERPNLVLFIDEAHTMVGAGSALGAPSDAANVFKSVLARGEIRMIAATTLSEYKEYMQEDEALSRRFRLRSGSRAEHRRNPSHPVQPAPAAGTKLLGTPPRRGARNGARDVAALHAPPAPAGQSDWVAGHGRGARRNRSPLGSESATIWWRSSRMQHRSLRTWSSATSPSGSRTSRPGCRRGSSARRMLSGAVARRLVLNKGPLKDGFDRPDGVLLFLGPTGVGKTELAKAVAEFLFGDEKKMVRVDMSEYQDGSVSVDKLIGMPRGIVGSERGGVLTNQLKDNPYTRHSARRSGEGKSEPAECLPAGVRRRMADRRSRQARVPERRGGDHDVEHRVGELPEAGPVRSVSFSAQSASTRCRVRSCANSNGASRRSSGIASMRSCCSLRFPTMRCARSSKHYLAQVEADTSHGPGKHIAHLETKPSSNIVDHRVFDGIWRSLPEARHRREGEAALERAMAPGDALRGGPEGRRPSRGPGSRQAPVA